MCTYTSVHEFVNAFKHTQSTLERTYSLLARILAQSRALLPSSRADECARIRWRLHCWEQRFSNSGTLPADV